MRHFTMISRGLVAAGVAGLMSVGFAGTALAESNTDNPNHEAYWEAWLEEEGFVNVDCEKIHDEGLDSSTWTSDGDYLLVVLKAGSEESSEGDPNTVFGDVEEGDVLETEDGKDISHIIVCTGEEEGETSTPTPTPTPTTSAPRPTPSGPMVETDVPETGGSTTPAILGGAAVLAGLGLAAGAMRRRGEH